MIVNENPERSRSEITRARSLMFRVTNREFKRRRFRASFWQAAYVISGVAGLAIGLVIGHFCLSLPWFFAVPMFLLYTIGFFLATGFCIHKRGRAFATIGIYLDGFGPRDSYDHPPE